MKTRRYLSLCLLTGVLALFIRQVPVGGCSVGYPPANLGFRVVLDDEPAAARHGILQTLLRRLRIQTV